MGCATHGNGRYGDKSAHICRVGHSTNLNILGVGARGDTSPEGEAIAIHRICCHIQLGQNGHHCVRIRGRGTIIEIEQTATIVSIGTAAVAVRIVGVAAGAGSIAIPAERQCIDIGCGGENFISFKTTSIRQSS